MDRRFSDFIGGSISAMEPRSDSQRGDGEEGECWCMMGRGPMGPVCVHMIGVKRSFRRRNEEIEGGDCTYRGWKER